MRAALHQPPGLGRMRARRRLEARLRGPVALVLLASVACAAGPDDRARAAGVVAEADASPRVAEAATAWPAVRVQVVEVRRVGDAVVRLRLAIVNQSPTDAFEVGDRLAARRDEAGTVGGVQLVDRAGGRRLFVLRDVHDRPACSTAVLVVPPAERRVLWADFPAPPRDVTAVTVVIPGAAPFENVPVM